MDEEALEEEAWGQGLESNVQEKETTQTLLL